MREALGELRPPPQSCRLRGQRLPLDPLALPHHLIQQQARRRPDAAAAAFRGHTLSYGELNRRANRIARRLGRAGVGPESLVGVHLARSPEMLVALLGVIKSGAAYLPLDPDYPQERLALILDDARCHCLLTQEDLLSRWPDLPVPALCLDRQAGEIAREDDDDPAVEVDGDNLAYVIYTSGSTGRPKGVQISQRSMANLLAGLAEGLGFTASSRLLAVTTISFDISVLELFLPLTRGGVVEVAGREEVLEPERLLERLGASGATHLQATPSLWRLLLGGGWRGEEGLKMLSGGEALTRELSRELLKRGCGLWNLYGPTETTIWSSSWEVKEMSGPVLIGGPVANTDIYVLDERQEEVGEGEVGEICIGGAGLSRGYVKRGDQTGERFVPDPYGEAGSRMYRTGDLGRVTGEGELECLGRVDSQVKVRGHRVELGEIEGVLNECAGVKESAVVVRESGGESQLVAYVWLEDAGVSVGELRLEMGRKLPEYMRARLEVVSGALPRLSNGKLDRRGLSAQADGGEGGGSRGGERVLARTEMEREIVVIWEEVLGLRGLGVTEDFFDLGGHSLLAMQLIARLREAFDIELSMRGLFELPTVGKLATAIAEFKHDNENVAVE